MWEIFHHNSIYRHTDSEFKFTHKHWENFNSWLRLLDYR